MIYEQTINIQLMTLVSVIGFIQVRLLDVIDIILVAILLYHLYKLIRGTGAMNIFIGILSIYAIWWLVRIFEMELLTEILGQFVSVGVLALIIVFQPEIRKFLLILGTRSFLHSKSKSFLSKFWAVDEAIKLNVNALVNACENMSLEKTGALIILTKDNKLEFFLETGERLDAKVSRQLLETIFFKNSPLHDGAVIIGDNKIRAARCVLPVTDKTTFPTNLGLRHRAALGITEQTDAFAIVVSEQTGYISYAKDGQITRKVKPLKLKEVLAREFSQDFPDIPMEDTIENKST